MKNVMILTGAGQIGMAIARRMGAGMKIVIGDKNPQHAASIAETMNWAGFDALPVGMDLSSRDSILALIDTARSCGEISMLVNAAGVSPSQASVETILRVDLYGTAVLLEEVGRVICRGGVGVTVSSQSGHRLPALGEEADRLLATTPAEELLALEILQPRNIRDTLHAYQLAKRCNVKRVMAEAVRWGRRGARINSISPGIIVTPLALDEFGAASHRAGPPEQGDRRRTAHQHPYGQHPPAADPRETRRRQLARSGQVRLDPRDSRCLITDKSVLRQGAVAANFAV